MNDISFCVKAWQACSSSFHLMDDQLLSSLHGSLCIAQDSNLQPTSIQPMLRRRLSKLGKMSLWCVDQAIKEACVAPEDVQTMPCVFASQHGEVGRTTDILQNYVTSGEVSPTAFSLSVHNAVAGIYSIANGMTGNISAVAAGEQTLAMGLLEAASILRAGQYQDVLCVIYDQNIPERLKTGVITPDFDFAIALVLTVSGPLELRLSRFDAGLSSDFSAQPHAGVQTHPFLQFADLLLDTGRHNNLVTFPGWRIGKQVA